jgi:hypothetical protein
MIYLAMTTAEAEALRTGAPDAYGAVPERAMSDGVGKPCRHCLGDVPAGEEMLILAHRPFPDAQPYAETGPIFLCAQACTRHEDGLPQRYAHPHAHLLVKGYWPNDRIRYGVAQIVHGGGLEAACADILSDPGTAYVHVRSALNNCYQFRVERG